MSMIDDPMIGALSRFLDVDVARLKLIGSNLANIDTPGYQTRDLDFGAELARAQIQAQQVQAQAFAAEGEAGGMVVSASYAAVARPVRGLLARPDGNNVSVERESLLLAETQMKFNLGVQLLKDEFHTVSQAINSGGTSS